MIDEKAVREKLIRHCAECKAFASNNCDECTVPTMLVAVERHIEKEEDKERRMIDLLKVLFPALMVLGALGSAVVNVIDKCEFAVTLQWLGAAVLYTALLLRNMR